jgi:FAD/FMN-containing dehydrogenase
MGLTGHILEVEFQLHRIPSPWIVMESWRVGDIDEYVSALNEAAPKWPMTVGWIDCLHRGRRIGRGILMAGRWARADEAPQAPPPLARRKSLPVELPNWVINRWSVGGFNGLYYWKHLRRSCRAIVGWESFFYPLDAMADWNRVYGKRGFTQYQCVVPRAAGSAAVRGLLELLTRLGGASPLCVIKDCGEEGKGLLSFPKAGTSIAVDMAVTPHIERVIDRLNEFVIAAGGRIYLSKDRFTRREHFAAMEPRLDKFQAVRHNWDPQRRFRSAQSVRILGDQL